jgi:hypothetical protein
VIKGHVLFSDDGLRLWASKDRLAKARRNQCKNWWNDEWRDRLLAVMAHLAGQGQQIVLSLAPNVAITLSSRPELFESPVSYIDPSDIVKEEELDEYSFEEEEGELDDEGSDDAEEKPDLPAASN